MQWPGVGRAVPWAVLGAARFHSWHREGILSGRCVKAGSVLGWNLELKRAYGVTRRSFRPVLPFLVVKANAIFRRPLHHYAQSMRIT